MSVPAVFVRIDAVKRPLMQPYSGPFQVLERNDKTFTLDRSGKPWVVSIDRLKPCFTYDMSVPSNSSPTTSPSAPPAATASAPRSVPPAAPMPQTQQDRSVPPTSLDLRRTSQFGRRLKPPDRFCP